MILTSFLESLLQAGSVSIPDEMTVFQAEDLKASVKLIQHYYEEDKLEMPHEAPRFMPDAAIWSAQFLFHSIQLAMLRDLGEEVVEQFLLDYGGPVNPESVYSADLLLRYLPDLFYLAKGLAPEDILVKILKSTARKWPFSAVGMELEGDPDLLVILSHPSLRKAYNDRVIAVRDKKRAETNIMNNLVLTAMGEHGNTLWPGFEPLDLDKGNNDNKDINDNGNVNGENDLLI